MTEVLSITQSDANHQFRSPLTSTSPSQSSLLQDSSSLSRSTPNLKSRYTAFGCDPSLPTSEPSSAPSSPYPAPSAFSRQPSYASTPSSSFSLDDHVAQQSEEIYFPSYNDTSYPDISDITDVTTSPEAADLTPLTRTPPTTEKTPQSPLFEPDQTAGDDMAIRCEPTRHVDYLSHCWKEEDIWASWRHIVARRKVYSNSMRLENASWRTWSKFKNRLKTVSPETLNWMKDHDVTWLYGPLQTGSPMQLRSDPIPSASQLYRGDSFASKKPILKKRSLSEIMLQRSLSSSTLMKQATDALRAQQPNKILRDQPVLESRKLSDFAPSSGSGTPLTRTTTDFGSYSPSISSSGIETPSTKRHIHFNNKVEQCISINKDEDDRPNPSSAIYDDGESSDEDMLTMKPVNNATKAKISRPSTPRNSFSSENKTIAMLPSTTLNYRGDTPEPDQQHSKQKTKPSWCRSAKLSPSPSQQTIRPSNSSTNFLLDEEDDADMDWQPSTSQQASVFPRGGIEINTEDEDDDSEMEGMRRTPSGMFMPCDDEDNRSRDGIIGRVVDTVNTARDIAHVIWNVGWRG